MDREKVIKAWECCNPFNRKCNECPYEKDCYHDGISRHMVADALVLLKEQEAVKPNPVHNSFRWFACGKCDCSITREDRFCPRCGKAVKWE